MTSVLLRSVLVSSVLVFMLSNSPARGGETTTPLAPESTPAQPPTKDAKTATQKDSKPATAGEAKPAPPASREIVVTVTATREERDVYEVPNSVTVLKQEQLTQRQQIANFVDAFQETPGVMVQKTAQSHGSPFIRGFTGYRNLLLVDGVRLNNSAYRDGPNQYWATVDPLCMERLELVRGPGSALYGSDAVGGAVNVLTKGTDTWSDHNAFGGAAYYRFSVAERANIGRVELKGSLKDKLGLYIGGAFKDYDDFVAGGGTGVTRNTAFQAFGGDAKLQYRPTKNQELAFAWQQFENANAPRTEQTRYAIPFEGSQRGTDFVHDLDNARALGYVKYKVSDVGNVVNAAEVTLSYQRTEEDLFRVRPRDADPNGPRRRVDHQEFGLDTLGAQVQLRSRTPIGTLTYGGDYYHDSVGSSRREYNMDIRFPGVYTRRPHTQGPLADDSSYDLAGVYLQDEANVLNDYVTLTASGRFDYAQVQANKVESPTNNAEWFDLGRHWESVTGSFRFLVRPDKERGDHWHVFGGVSQAFRAPSLYDMTSYDSSSAYLELPTGDLEPETFVTLELGAKARYDTVTLQASYYHTFIHNLCLRSPTGETDSSGRAIVQKSNSGKGFVKGLEVEASWSFLRDYTLWANVTWTEGDLLQYSGSVREVKPLSRLIPVMSHMGLRYAPVKSCWWAEIHADVATDADRLSVLDRADYRRIPPNGTPGYAVFGVRGGVDLLKKRLTVTGAVENIANVNYRVHGSGQNMPGTNFILSACYRW